MAQRSGSGTAINPTQGCSLMRQRGVRKWFCLSTLMRVGAILGASRGRLELGTA